MQIKEPEVNSSQKAVVKVSSDGEVMKCAKGLDGAECGYKAGAKVCGACGAMAMQIKDVLNDPEGVTEDNGEKETVENCKCGSPISIKGVCQKCGKPVKMKGKAAADPENAAEDTGETETCECDNPVNVKGICQDCGLPIAGKKMLEDHSYTPRMIKKKSNLTSPDADFGAGMEREADEEVYDTDNFDPKKRARSIMTGKSGDSDAPAFVIDSDITGKEFGTGKERQLSPNDMGFNMDLKKKRKKRRLDSMGIKSDNIDESDLFLCGLAREVKSASEFSPCADCRGGCKSAQDEPDLLEIEGLAEDMLLGKVHNSGYSDQHDMFVVQVERKDGQYVEAYFTGEGELDGWFRIPEEEVMGKSAVVDIETAVSKALGVIEGKALGYGVGEFEGYEAYAIEVEGLDGKSYDVFVTPDGDVLGYDQYEWDYDDTVEGKAAYSQDQRDAMAKKGHALPDGSYPIDNASDLENAIMAFGRAKDKPKVKAHIMKRAKELGREDLIPDSWDSEGADDTDSANGEKSVFTDIQAALLEMDIIAAQQEIY